MHPLSPQALTNLLHKFMDFCFIRCIVIPYLDAQVILDFSTGDSFQLASVLFWLGSITLGEFLYFLTHLDALTSSISFPVPIWNKEFLGGTRIPFNRRQYLKTEIWMIGVPSPCLGFIGGWSWDPCVHTYTHRHNNRCLHLPLSRRCTCMHFNEVPLAFPIPVEQFRV